jgi:adenylosuccinate lyase
MLDRFTWIVDGLVVHPDRMRRNLDASHGLVFSHRLLLALVAAGMPRDAAYRVVQRNAMVAWHEERDFRALVDADSAISSRLDAAARADVFDLDATVAQLDTVFDRLRTLVRKEDPVHV